MLRGALIGLGNIAVRGHLPAYRTQRLSSAAEIVAVCDVVEQSRERAKEVLPGARFYSDAGTMLDNESLDFVDVCAPPHTHGGYIRACADRKIHVLCEKPLAEGPSSVSEIRKAVGQAGVVFVPCHQYKYSPLWKSIHDFIVSGELGTIAVAQFNVYRMQADPGTAGWNPAWRTSRAHSGGGILADTGAHYFYLAQYFFGLPQRIGATLRTLKHKEYAVEDTALVTIEYPGTLMQINLTWAAGQRANSVQISGTKGALSYDGVRLLHLHERGVTEIPMPDVSDKSQYIAWYASLFDEFLCRIQEGNSATDLLDEATAVMRMLELSYRSSEQNAMMEWEGPAS